MYITFLLCLPCVRQVTYSGHNLPPKTVNFRRTSVICHSELSKTIKMTEDLVRETIQKTMDQDIKITFCCSSQQVHSTPKQLIRLAKHIHRRPGVPTFRNNSPLKIHSLVDH